MKIRMNRLALLALPLLLGIALALPAAYAEDAPTGEAPPAEEEQQLPTAPAFKEMDIHGNEIELSDYAGKWVVLEWVNLDCPFVKKHYHESHKHMQKLQTLYTGKDVIWLSVCSSARGKQGHFTAEVWRAKLEANGAKPTTVLLDENGDMGRTYGATKTPEFRIINPQGKIVYEGAIDNKPQPRANVVLTAKCYVAEVLDAVLAGEPSPHSSHRPYGCSVKYAD